MKTINLLFGCHSHQPVGNFGHVFKDAYEKAYRPFVDLLEGYPHLRVTLHYTGPLWDWFLENAPGFVQRLAHLAAEGRVEIMGGAYYEPLLCAIPERDALAQIERMNAFCETHFGHRPKGMWLTERVWEPQMARFLAKAGLEYASLDDTHFLYSGLERQDLFGYYMTEDEGYAIKVFPILEKLRYTIPFHPVPETIAYLRENASEDGLRCAVIHDDGEKFGVWPGTHGSVYGEGWLEAFFDALTENRDWIHTITYQDYMQKARALGRVYIPCASYREMTTWTLPAKVQLKLEDIMHEFDADPVKAERYGNFVRGGFWRVFLTLYEEANNMQKRMLRVSGRLDRLKQSHAGHELLAPAEKLLHQGQCNCAYWHGVFGGLYLGHLRTAVYEKLIEADAVLDRVEKDGNGWLDITVEDFDADSYPEVVVMNTRLGLFFDPSDGGSLFEIDFKPQPFNFCNTLTRREEPYHAALRSGAAQFGDDTGGDKSIHDIVRAKEKDLDKLLIYDPYRRTCLRDRFLDRTVEVRDLWQCTAPEMGDFVAAPYEHELTADGLVMWRNGRVGFDPGQPVTLRKTIQTAPDASAFEIRYDIAHHGDVAFEALFGVEFAVNLLSGNAPDKYYRLDGASLEDARLDTFGRLDGLTHLAFRDDWKRVELGLRFQTPASVFVFPVETVNNSEGGQERSYQGSVAMPAWPVALEPGGTAAIALKVEITGIKAD